MKLLFLLGWVLLTILPAYAVDETASMLIAMGEVRLGDINERIVKEYPDKRAIYWNIVGSAYHDFSKTPRTDVIIGVAGYLDVGVVYNSERQMVEDAGSGFAYFHKGPDGWNLVQVGLAGGKKYLGYQGADLTGQGADQLVVYSSSGTTQIADIYRFDSDGKFKKMATVHGFGEGLSIADDSGKLLLVANQKAMIKNGDEFQIYYGRPYQWNGKEFSLNPDPFLDMVQSYDPVHSLDEESPKDLEFLEGYLASHPDDFCALADCFDLSRRMGLKDKTTQYRKELMKMKDKPISRHYADKWLDGKNQVAKQIYLDWVSTHVK
jgi:hypothetical protein